MSELMERRSHSYTCSPVGCRKADAVDTAGNRSEVLDGVRLQHVQANMSSQSPFTSINTQSDDSLGIEQLLQCIFRDLMEHWQVRALGDVTRRILLSGTHAEESREFHHVWDR
jgi:hypothetical protein